MYNVSIVIPVFNMQDCLSQSIDSALSQSLCNIEIICIDDGSTDNSYDIMKKYEVMYHNVRVIRQNRSGSGLARNVGILAARGMFVFFLDADDTIPTQEALFELFVAAKTNNALIAGGSLLWEKNGVQYNDSEQSFDTDGWIQYSDYQYPYGYTRFIYNRQFLIENELFFKEYSRYQDPPFMVYVFSKAKVFWSCKTISYLTKVVDKKLNWSSNSVVYGVLCGIHEILVLAMKHGFGRMINYIVEDIVKGLPYIYLGVIHGKSELGFEWKMIVGILSKLRADLRALSIFDELEEIEKYINELGEKQRAFLNYARQFPGIIILGIGEQEKRIFDIIDADTDVCFSGFMESRFVQGTTARGKLIHDILHYDKEEYIDCLVVLNEDKVEQLNRDRKKMLVNKFAHIYLVNGNLFDILNYQINEELHAVM